MKLKNLNMSEREKTTLLAGLFIVLVVAFYLYMYQPTNMEINRLKMELQTSEAKLNTVQEIISNPADFEKAMNSNKNEIEEIKSKLPTGEGATSFIRSVEEKAEACNLKIVSIKPEGIVDKGQYNIFQYTLTVRGQYQNTTKYSKSLENMPRLLNITGWKLEKSESGITTAILSLEIYGVKEA